MMMNTDEREGHEVGWESFFGGGRGGRDGRLRILSGRVFRADVPAHRERVSPVYLLFRCVFDNFDFVVGEAVEVVDEAVDLGVGGVDLALERGLVVAGLGVGKAFVQVQHPPDECEHLVVLGLDLPQGLCYGDPCQQAKAYCSARS